MSGDLAVGLHGSSLVEGDVDALRQRDTAPGYGEAMLPANCTPDTIQSLFLPTSCRKRTRGAAKHDEIFGYGNMGPDRSERHVHGLEPNALSGLRDISAIHVPALPAARRQSDRLQSAA